MKKRKPITKFMLINVCLLGGKIVAIGIKDGQIVYVGPRQEWECIIDGRGLYAFPGRVEAHIHDREPGHKYKEDIESAQRAAIVGGTTTICAMANTNPCITTADRFLAKLELLKPARITYYQWFGATPSNINEFRKIAHLPECLGAKVCTAITTNTDEMLIDKLEDQIAWCKVHADYNKIQTTHAENQERISRNTKRLKKQAAAHGLPVHCDIREALAEEEAIEQMIKANAVAGCRLNICHVSTANGARNIKSAAQRGQNITFEIGPQYWRFTQKDLEGEDGWRKKFNPPVHTPDDAHYLEAQVCDERVSNAIVAIDHAPHGADEKRRHHPDPFKVPSGMPGLDTATSLCWDLVHQGKMTPQRFADVTSRLPAKVLGLKTKGEIALGFDADIMLIDPKATVTFRDEDMLTKCGWTPFRGVTTHGVVKLVIARGNVLLNRL